jgi:putative hydrolase of the HAD superfamily
VNPASRPGEGTGRPAAHRTVWLFDLDNTLHNATHASLRDINQRMSEYIVRELGLAPADADALRTRYWRRYGATLLGLVRHHGVDADHFLHDTHRLPGLEGRVHGHPHDLAALKHLPGRRFILTNAPRAYTQRVLAALGIAHWFDGVIAIEDMAMFGELRPKPDARMLRRLVARLKVPAQRCVLVEDTLEHQKAARSIGMRTVWMQRWSRAAVPSGVWAAHLARRPVYVGRRVASLRTLRR